MATQPKKTNTNSSTGKTPTRKRRRRKSTKSSTFKKSIFIVLGVFLMIFLVPFGYFLGQHDAGNGQNPIEQTNKTESKKKLLQDLSKIKNQKTQEKKPPT